MEQRRSSMLEVSVTHQPPQWEWQVTCDGKLVAKGFELGKAQASFEGNKTLFRLLAAGWDL
jgi:hypothetical protein